MLNGVNVPMHLDKIATALLFTFCTGTALAQNFHKGLYIGANSGATFVTGQIQDTYITGINFINDERLTTFYHNEASERGYNAGILVGWNFYVDPQFVLGVELNGNAFSNNAYQTFWNSTEDLDDNDLVNWQESWKIRYTADLLFKPGVLISESTELYGIIGLSYAELKTQLKNRLPAFAGSSRLTFNDSNNIVGIVLGAGLTKQLCNQLGFFTSYQFTYFGTGETDLANGVQGNSFGQNEDFRTFVRDRKLKVDASVFKVGLVYTF